MEKKSFQSISGDIIPDFPREKEDTGLGIIDDIINMVGSLVPLVIGIFKNPPADAWSIWTEAERQKYVNQSLQIATTAVITGKAISVTNTFRNLIARVEKNYDWAKWEKKNSEFLPALFSAEDNVKKYQVSGYKRWMDSINPQMIYKVLHPATAAKPATASMFGDNKLLMIIGGGILLGFLIKELAFNHEKEDLFALESEINSNKKQK